MNRPTMFYDFLVVFCTVVIAIQAEENRLLTRDLKITLPGGDQMPMIGYGTGGIHGVETMKQVLGDALSAGYRLIDTAAAYKNEEDIGNALKELLPKHNLTRKDIFITSKLPAREDTYGEHAYETLQKSVQRLGFDYVDLYLIHFPGFFPPPEPNMNFSKLRDESWKQLVKGYKDGLVRNIGVSNYNIKHLTELLNNDHGVKPAVNQVEWHPEFHQDDLLDLCKKEGVALQAYFSLGGVQNKTTLLEKPEVKTIATKLGKTPGQVLLRWAVQQNVLIIPKSRSKNHIEQNIDLNFKISESDMKILSNLKKPTKYIWDPDMII